MVEHTLAHEETLHGQELRQAAPYANSWGFYGTCTAIAVLVQVGCLVGVPLMDCRRGGSNSTGGQNKVLIAWCTALMAVGKGLCLWLNKQPWCAAKGSQVARANNEGYYLAAMLLSVVEGCVIGLPTLIAYESFFDETSWVTGTICLLLGSTFAWACFLFFVWLSKQEVVIVGGLEAGPTRGAHA